MTKRDKVSVSRRAVIARINRKLIHSDEAIRATRGDRYRMELGDYYRLDFNRNFIMEKHVNVEELAREIECLSPWERMVED